MTHDPTAWTKLGKAIRDDRDRQGLTRDQLAAKVIERGGTVSAKTIANLEKGDAPKRGVKPPSAEPIAAALGWIPGSVDRILDGEPPADVLAHRVTPATRLGPREVALGLLASVFEFSRAAVAAGASPRLRDAFDRAAQDLVASIPVRTGGGTYGLAAYRPHGEGGLVPDDDAARIFDAMDR